MASNAMKSNGGVLASCVFCDFCVSDANYQEHLQVKADSVLKPSRFSQKQMKIMLCSQVWHKITVDLEEGARRVLGLPLNNLDVRAVKDEVLGDVEEGPRTFSLSSSFATSTQQEPVREVGGRRGQYPDAPT